MPDQKFLETTNQTVSWFSKRDADNELSIQPPFQRNPVWSNVQKSYLIDTILRGYPIPEIYMQFSTDAEGNDQYVLVDGQQRIRACLEFIADEYDLVGDELGNLQGSKFSDLGEDQRKKIFNYVFVVRKLPEMDDVELRSIFSRLNRNVVALNKQELRHSTYWGRFISLMESLSEDERWAELGVFTANDVRRMLDVEFISELAVAYLHGHQNKKDNLDTWYQAYEVEFAREADVKKVFNKVLGELTRVFGESRLGRWAKKSDFYTLFTVMAAHEDSLPLARDERATARRRLANFARQVEDYLADPENAKVGKAPREFARGVERAASDVANRRARFAALERRLFGED
jgi:uncharacterized protein with ParB-like and HNH nuclease domain